MKSEIIASTARRYGVLVATLLVASAAWAQSQPQPPAQAANAELGRLFYTPQQRAELDHKRATNAVEAEVVVERLVTVNGRVSRSSGKTTTWINGVPQFDVYKGRDPSAVSIDDNGTDTKVSVGDTLDRARGEVHPAVPSGDIEIHVTRRAPQSGTH